LPPALLSSAWMFICLLIIYLSVYLFFYHWLWRVWNLIYTVFLRLHDFSIFIPISYISTVFLYRLTCFHLMLSFIMLSLITCLISPPDMLLPDHATTWHMPLLWYHLSLASCHVNTWPVIIIFTRIMYLLSCIIYSDLLSCIIYTVTWIYSTHVPLLYMNFCTPEFLIMTCSCYSRKLIII